jgi:hypothetical protein
MMFLRSGDVTTWWGAEAHALHMMDVDTCYHESPLRRDIKFGPGGNVLASSPRQGPQAPPTPLKGLDPIPYLLGYQHFGPIPSYIYTWGEGLIDYYHVTGDRRALEVATGYARTLAHLTTHDRRYQYGLGRSAGWALVTMAMVYAVEPDPKIAAGAKLLVDTIAAELEPGRDRLSTIHPKAVEDRMITLTVRGLIRWHRVTGDAKTRKLIVDLMNLYLKVAFGDDGLPGGGTWPEERKASAPSQGFANLEALAYAYHLTGERRFFDAGVPALCRAVEWINHPTEELFFPRPLRGVFPFLAIADRLGVLEKIPGVGRWLAP